MADKHLIQPTIDEVVETSQSKDYVPEGIKMVHAPGVWKKAKGKDIVQAFIDTGIDKTHPDLKNQIIGGKDFTGSGDFQDDNGHGTHTSGTAVAALNNQGVVGVAPEAKVLALKALDGQGKGSSSWINAALAYAIDWKGPNGEKVDVISMSLGGPANQKEHELIQKAVKQGILIVCAAGNSGDGNPKTPEKSFPGDYNEVVEVGAVNFQKKLAKFSNTNNEIDVVAPGVGVVSCWLDGKYAKLSGTSMATPHVSGAAALLKHLTGAKSGQELFSAITKHADDLGLAKTAQGHGLIDLTKQTKKPDQPKKPKQPKKPSGQIDISVKSEALGIDKTITIDY